MTDKDNTESGRRTMQQDRNNLWPQAEGNAADTNGSAPDISRNGMHAAVESNGSGSPDFSHPLVIKLAELIERHPVRRVDKRPESMEPGVVYYTVSPRR